MKYKKIFALAFIVLVTPSVIWAENLPIGEDFQGSWAESYAKCEGDTKLIVSEDGINLIDKGVVTKVKEYDTAYSCYGGSKSDGTVICVLVYSEELDLIDIDTRNGSATPQRYTEDEGSEGFSLENVQLVRCD
ncbi:hypothetical protein [Billgrantia kenyensis]|uniref:Uncharacterized protein n=1 Tax=Billgrantia kenyensis TaxID=321266 RepID=A0A7V9W562_9GAMM|nr:hypothetical protein [Halomonas kenyensis]MBA2781264.1 hypothetical protein [Halomonas kenyensis]MCG6663932.1 hypothetical protein [Halomonas kenyensis]